MTGIQWQKIVDRLRKYKEVVMPDGDLLFFGKTVMFL
jgi:hypothetical protein